MYIHISSSDSKNFFQTNKSDSFRVILPKALRLGDASRYEIALISIYTPSLKEECKPQYLTVNIGNVCEPSIIGECLRPLLRRVFPSALGTPKEFTSPHYVTLTSPHISLIEIYLLDENGVAPSFNSGPLHVTLHVRELY